jgi:osmotically-inducible protein OsmY
MKTDSQLLRDVQDELAWEPSIQDQEIAVAAKDGVVTLSGYTPTYADKYIAVRAAERVLGVKAVADDIKVMLPKSFQRTDTEVAHEVVNALRANIQVPDDRIKAKVDEGWVTLEGSVEWQYQKNAAEYAVRYLAGVKGVTNLIALKPKHVSTFEVSHKIREALRRNAELDAERIIVEAADGRVTLKGSVRSYAERQDAERAAWQAPGVTSIDDRILVAP